ncbi:hypothetical protein BX666DRAFT_767167 [Dichotomocladium elegans]|nr:hypothetical protein BX666DRAFT_767167 [Dichotomocladium elegans]
MEEQNEEYYYPVDHGVAHHQQQQHYHHQQSGIAPRTEITPSVPSHDHSNEEITPPATEKAASNGDKASETSSHENVNEVDSITSVSDNLAQDTSEMTDKPTMDAQAVEEEKHDVPVAAAAANKNGAGSMEAHAQPPKQKTHPRQSDNPASKPKVPESAVKTIEPSSRGTKEANERVSPLQVPQQIANDNESVASMSRSNFSATKRNVQKKEFADNVLSTAGTPSSPISSNPQTQEEEQQRVPSVNVTTKRSSSLPVPAPLPPKSKYQSGPPPSSSVTTSERLFSEPDFAFSHNADKFSIKKGYDIPPLPTVPPPQPKTSKKSVSATQQQSPELLKPKRRSVHDLFRGRKESRR